MWGKKARESVVHIVFCLLCKRGWERIHFYLIVIAQGHSERLHRNNFKEIRMAMWAGLWMEIL